MTKSFLPMLATIAIIAGTSSIEAQPVNPTCSEGCATMNTSWGSFCGSIDATNPLFATCLAQSTTALIDCTVSCTGPTTAKPKKH